jgi:hypothetical protein
MPCHEAELMEHPIHTLNSRSHVMLEILRDHLGLVGTRMKAQIQAMHRDLVDILASKGVDYSALRSALVPLTDRNEAPVSSSISQATGSNFYGPDVFDRLLPLLDKRTTQSIRVGDLLGDDQRLISDILRESMVPARHFPFRHLDDFVRGCTSITCRTPPSSACTRLSAHLRHTWAPAHDLHVTRDAVCVNDDRRVSTESRSTLVMSHEDDRPNSEDINITFYRLHQFGYRVASCNPCISVSS